MPVYEYRCKSCGTTHEIEHGYNDERPTKCPTCGGELVRVFHPIGVVFKGSGFHKTDYAKSGLKPSPSSESSGKSGDSKSGDTSSAPAPSADSGGGSSSGSESKPAPAKPSESKSASPPKSDK
jgi:putative FmdB family regulatory protein